MRRPQGQGVRPERGLQRDIQQLASRSREQFHSRLLRRRKGRLSKRGPL